MTGRSVVITGGNTGIGKASAEALARLGARVVITSRDAQRGAQAVSDIRQASGNNDVECVGLDLASFASVRGCAQDLLGRLDSIHVLDLNAGGVLSQRKMTEDGFEMQFQVNHLGQFLFAHLLLDRLKQSASARIVVLSSFAHTQARRGLDFDDLQWERRSYRGMSVYAATKLMNLYFTFEFARRLADSDVTVNAAHPGLVASQFGLGGDTSWLRVGLFLARPFARTPEKGARTAVWLAASPDVKDISGGFFFDCRPAQPSKAALDPEAAHRFWDVSEKLSLIA